MATDFDLLLSSLTLLSSSTSTDTGPDFTLFATLPSELRRNIIRHALPAPRVLKLTANILVADPSFGLYLVFSISPPNIEQSQSTTSFGVWGHQNLKAPRRWYVETRKLNLLVVNWEFRDIYLEAFPFSLPAGLSKPWLNRGMIRYSSLDNIHFMNFGALVNKPVISQAIRDSWRLQDFWTEIVELHVEPEVYMLQYLDCCVEALAKMKGLKRVKVHYKDNPFGEPSVIVQVKRATDARLQMVERLLKDAMGIVDGDGTRMGPQFELLDLSEIEGVDTV